MVQPCSRQQQVLPRTTHQRSGELYWSQRLTPCLAVELRPARCAKCPILPIAYQRPILQVLNCSRHVSNKPTEESHILPANPTFKGPGPLLRHLECRPVRPSQEHYRATILCLPPDCRSAASRLKHPLAERQVLIFRFEVLPSTQV